MGDAFKLSVNQEGIAILLFDLPGEKVNKLSLPELEELERMLDQAASNTSIKAMVITSGKENIFIAGADLHTFEESFKEPPIAEKLLNYGHKIFNKLEELPFPTIAVINGACLGGGMELALACTYRVATDNPKTLLGLPEVTLGIIPGWGGTQRMPRLIGLAESLPMILGGKPMNAQKAWKLKLVDAILPAEFLDDAVHKFVSAILNPYEQKKIKQRRQRGGVQTLLLEGNPIGRSLLFNKAEKDVKIKTKGHYPAPIVALNLIRETYTLPLKEGLKREIETFVGSLPNKFVNAKELIHLFFTQEALKKDPGASVDVKPKKISAAGVLGAGTMGSGISWLFSNSNVPVRLKDIDWKAVGKGYGAAYSIYSKLVKDKRMKPNEAKLKFHLLSGTVDYSGFKNADIVVEAAVESLELKHKLLKELETVVRPDTVIGTNTSSLTLAAMSSEMDHPERLVGMHFFNPPNKMPLVEVVAGEKTSPEAIATAVDISRKLGKTPIVVRDCPGFLVNRIFVIGANEIMRMYEEGMGYERLEKVMLDFGMPMSPFALADEVGNDVGYKVGKAFFEAYGSRMAVPVIMEAMYAHELWGKKTRRGFYIYEGEKKKFNPKVAKLRKEIGHSNKEAAMHLSDQDILDRALLSMINESARCLQENIVSKPEYLDMAMVMGTGFPPFRGGLLRYADSLGIAYVYERLKAFQGRYGERFEPCALIVQMQRDNLAFLA